MSKNISMADVLALSVPERIQLAADIWDSVASVPESVALTDPEKKELDRRLAAYRADPEGGSPWEQVKARIRQKA